MEVVSGMSKGGRRVEVVSGISKGKTENPFTQLRNNKKEKLGINLSQPMK